MADCKISTILNTIGSQNASDLNPWCAGKYTSDNNFSLGNNQTCSVSSSTNAKYPKGTVFTCTNGSLTSVVKNQDGTITDAAGNKYKDTGGGNIVAVPPPPPPKAPAQDLAPAPTPAQDPVPAPTPAQDLAPAHVQDLAPAPASNSMTIFIVIAVLLVIGGGAFFFMRKPKTVSPMTAFGRKISKLTRRR